MKTDDSRIESAKIFKSMLMSLSVVKYKFTNWIQTLSVHNDKDGVSI